MIAKSMPHIDGETLRQLLEERLPRETTQHVETHLAACADCRDQLESIAGQRSWWDETAEILSESTLSARSGNLSGSSAIVLDASVDWIRPLLDVADHESSGIGKIDQYIIEGVIGQGGMGVVLRGMDCELNRPVAIKVLSPHLAGVGAARARFMREAQAAAAVVHPSIVPIYSVVPSARLPYIVMPCIGGGNLQQKIDREGPLDISEVLRIGAQISEGLAAAHRHGVIHRDIKPANILIEEGNGRVLISDFGLARALDDATLTVSGMIAGTPQYMSPEQARGESIDARSDLFSLGSLLYALAAGRPPYRAESPLAVLRKITEDRPRPIFHINEQTPAWFDDLVSRLMRIDVNRRIATADAAAALLRESHAHVRNPSVNALPKTLQFPSRAKRPLVMTSCAVGSLLVAWLAYTSMATRETIGTPPTTKPIPISADVSPQRLVSTLPWYDQAIDEELSAISAEVDRLSIEMDAALERPETTHSPEAIRDEILP